MPLRGIHTNLVENAIRPTAVGKKNWLFIGHADVGQRGAILYTLIENCRRLGLVPQAYLRDILTRHQLAGQRPHAPSLGQSSATTAAAETRRLKSSTS